MVKIILEVTEAGEIVIFTEEITKEVKDLINQDIVKGGLWKKYQDKIRPVLEATK